MQRLRLYDLRTSRLTQVIGVCTANSTELCSYVNSAQRRLIFAPEAGDEGWWGTWAEVAFTIQRDAPYITLPREIARLEAAVLCDSPVPIYNQFYEYLQFGNGRMPKQFRQENPNCLIQGMERNPSPTFVDLTNTPQLLRVYISNPADVAARIFFNGLDNNSKRIWSLDGAERVEGVFYQLQDSFFTTTEQFTRISGIQKDQTVAPVEVFQVDPNTGDEVLLVVLQPSETSALYRRYYFNNLPLTCCGNANQTQPSPLQLRAICKLEPLPVFNDTDYLVIQNLEAMIEECQSLRYGEMDTAASKAMSANSHKNAIRYLNGELAHYMGLTNPSVSFKPYGSAMLRNQRIGTMI